MAQTGTGPPGKTSQRRRRRLDRSEKQLGMVAAEIRRTREAAAASKHRSPVEGVLQGLTARRYTASMRRPGAGCIVRVCPAL